MRKMYPNNIQKRWWKFKKYNDYLILHDKGYAKCYFCGKYFNKSFSWQYMCSNPFIKKGKHESLDKVITVYTSACVECYNFSANKEMSKIREKMRIEKEELLKAKKQRRICKTCKFCKGIMNSNGKIIVTGDSKCVHDNLYEISLITGKKTLLTVYNSSYYAVESSVSSSCRYQRGNSGSCGYSGRSWESKEMKRVLKIDVE